MGCINLFEIIPHEQIRARSSSNCNKYEKKFDLIAKHRLFLN